MRYLLFIGVALILQGCFVLVIPPKEPESTQVAFDVACTNNMYGAGQEGIIDTAILITSNSEMENIIALINGVNANECVKNLSELNFNEVSVICIVDKQKGSGGHAIEINDVSSSDSKLIIQWSSISPDGNSTTVMTQPFIFATIDKSSLEAEFTVN